MATRTTEPADLRALWVAFVATFARALLGGIVGDINHGNLGYHIGGLFVSDDYSVSDRKRDRPMFRVDPDASGIDLTLPTDLMRLLTARIIAALRAGDPRVFFIREINGTLDGRNTINYDVLLGRQNYEPDDGHLFHIHLGIFRIYALTYAQILGFIEVCAGLAAGTLTPAVASSNGVAKPLSEEDDMTPEQYTQLMDRLGAVEKRLASLNNEQNYGEPLARQWSVDGSYIYMGAPGIWEPLKNDRADDPLGQPNLVAQGVLHPKVAKVTQEQFDLVGRIYLAGGSHAAAGSIAT